MANYFPFVGFTSAFWLVFERVLPALERRWPSLRTNLARRVGVHVPVALLVAVAGTFVVGPAAPDPRLTRVQSASALTPRTRRSSGHGDRSSEAPCAPRRCPPVSWGQR